MHLKCNYSDLCHFPNNVTQCMCSYRERQQPLKGDATSSTCAELVKLMQSSNFVLNVWNIKGLRK